MEIQKPLQVTLDEGIKTQAKIRYCLYARKSTESEERQVLSIDSQIKEMLQLAEREGLEIVRQGNCPEYLYTHHFQRYQDDATYVD